MSRLQGGFTLPGEAGYEDLTLKMAKKWGADVIRDSDGTELSPEIVNAGYGIYSTICIIRDHNEWAKKNMDKLQETFLMTAPEVASSEELTIFIMEGFYREQFSVNYSDAAMKYWQVYDRTTDTPLEAGDWTYDAERETVTIHKATPFHTYTVSFLAYRIWEEISMYNHVTNHWNKEHLMPVDPVYPETQAYLLDWFLNWCETHSSTTVVRFTSLFYNFPWIWGSSQRNRDLFTDWGSYDFTVSPLMLDNFAKKYGYNLTAEDFINQGKLQVTHMPATHHKRDWMEFINRFVIDFGKKLVDMTHDYGKKAYLFYDDSWVGTEPWGRHFSEFGFDGLIKCVFSGYEVRLCSGVDVPVHELRLHPYLFPVGLGGAPTFTKGGNPVRDARDYWMHVRRGLLRAPIERIGLGGYLHLTEDFPDFQDYIESISDEFRIIKQYLQQGKPYVKSPRIAVLHYWGRLRSWTLSGHFHETYMHDLIHVNEALSGLPLDVSYINFDDVREGKLKNFDIVINAGRAGSAWSGGDEWKDEKVIGLLNEWVYKGGVFIGIQDPSAVEGYNYFFRMADVLGVDKDMGEKVCHGKWKFDVEKIDGLLPDGYSIPQRSGMYLTDGSAKVLASHDGTPDLTIHEFGKGKGIYMGGFQYSESNTRMLLNLILWASGDTDQRYLTDNYLTECTYYPAAKKIVVINNAGTAQTTTVQTEKGPVMFTIPAYGSCATDI